jgi:hypothetical protein
VATSDPHRPGDAPARAVELLATGAWQQAHEIVQQEESALAPWLHGIVHTLEGDLGNARSCTGTPAATSRARPAFSRRSGRTGMSCGAAPAIDGLA